MTTAGYQNIEVKGYVSTDPKRAGSKFWNKGKWHNFINPLLPTDCGDKTFVEMGSNAGLFLRFAKEKGFRNVIGVESDSKAWNDSQAYQRHNGLEYKSMNKLVGGSFNFNEIPVADITLLANFHYHLDWDVLLDYLDQLQYKTVYCLVVSARVEGTRFHFRPKSEIHNIRNYFRDWEEVGAVYNIYSKSDPSPREMWSILFKSRKLQTRRIDDIRHGTKNPVPLYREEIIKKIIEGSDFNVFNTNYYKAWQKRLSKRYSEQSIQTHVINRIWNMSDVKINGMRKPILIQLDNKIIDGEHRLAMKKGLGYKNIIVRTV